MDNEASTHIIDTTVGMAKLSAFAAQYFEHIDTKGILDVYIGDTFPDLSGSADSNFSTDNHFIAHDLVMALLALEQRKDKDNHLSGSKAETIDTLTTTAHTLCKNAISNHNKIASNKNTRGRYADSYFFLTTTPTTHSAVLDRMLLTHAAPSFYSAKAAPKEFLDAARIVAKTWGGLLRKATPNAKQTLITPKDIEMEALPSEDSIPNLLPTLKKSVDITSEQIRTFERGIVNYLIMTGQKTIRVKNNQPSALSFACNQAGFFGKTTFTQLSMGTSIEVKCDGLATVHVDGTSLVSNFTIQGLTPSGRMARRGITNTGPSLT